ncbi:MAG: hypothetical protein D6739_11875, partial [Nitrospirae bacterium]
MGRGGAALPGPRPGAEPGGAQGGPGGGPLERLEGEEGRIAARLAARSRPVRRREVELAELEAALAQETAAGSDEAVAVATLKARWRVQRDGVAAALE